MAARFCPSCRNTIQPYDKFCNVCGRDLDRISASPQPVAPPSKPPRRWLKWGGIGCGGLLGLFIIVIILAVVFGEDVAEQEGSDPVKVDNSEPSPTSKKTVPDRAERVGPTAGVPSSPTATPTPTPMPTVTPTPAPIKMELAKLLDEYDQNKVRANTQLRYQDNGKIPVSTSGYVSRVEELYVIVSPTQEKYLTQELYCYYADVRAALHVTKGQHVSVTGRVIGMDGYSSDVHMFACEFEGTHYEKNSVISDQELRGCRQSNLVQIAMARIWQMAR